MPGLAYVELHCHSAFSFLDGASMPEELAKRAAELGYETLALTDHDGIAGSMEFAQACKAEGVRPITGAELTVALPPPGTGGAPELAHLTLLVEDARGYRNLCRLLTAAHAHTRDGPGREAGRPWVALELVLEHAEGLVCLSGCAAEGVLAGRIERGEVRRAAALAADLLEAFGAERLRVELQRPYGRHDRARNRRLSDLASRFGVATVATGNVHFHDRRRAWLQDAFVSVREGVPLDESEPLRRGNDLAALASPEGMAARFPGHPEAVAESAALAERLRFDLNADLGYSYPGSENADADRKLAEICRPLLAERYSGSKRRAEAEGRLEEELGVIRRLHLSGFFLLHRDVLELAREVAVEVRGRDSVRSVMPPGRGRGSSVSSIVCHLTGLSHVDPVEADLFSGRFLNEDTKSMPDIDLDFPRDIREVLIPRVIERYGKEKAALVAAFPTYRPRGAVRDLGKALGLPSGEIERIARVLGFHGDAGEIGKIVASVVGEERARSPRWRALIGLSAEAQKLPRHLSQHSGGMVISTRPLVEICPVVPAAMEGRQILQWDKDSCDDAGFIKIDLLGLGMLSAVERCVVEIDRVRDEPGPFDISRIPLDDKETYESIQAAETTGVFQIESRAQMQMLPRTLPENLDDLTIQVALVRPGPIQGGAVHPYIERRKAMREAKRTGGSFQIPYEHPSLEPVLRETLGTIVYQEQVLEVARALADFSPSEAESLRRAMSRKRSEEEIEKHHRRFVEQAVSGEGKVPEEIAERVWGQIRSFSGFGFPKAHSTAFGLLAYQSAWLRVHRAPEFLCSLLNEQPMGFYPPDALLREAQRRGVRSAPVDVDASAVLCRVEWLGGEPTVRIGLGYVKGVKGAEMEALAAERERGGPYADVADLAARSGVGRDGLERLAWAGALDGLPVAEGRREGSWRLAVIGAARGGGDQLSLPLEAPPAPALEPLDSWQRIIEDYRSTGVNLGEHPLALLREGLGDGVVRSADLKRIADGAEVEVAGMGIARQRPETAKGITFILLEDELGTINLVVPSGVYARRRETVRSAPLIRAQGKLERREGVINVLVSDLEPLRWSRPTPATPADGTKTPLYLGKSSRRQAVRVEPGANAGDELAARRRARELAVAELRAVMPPGHSFGRRGR